MTKIIKKYQSVRISFKYFLIVASAHGNMKKELMQQESGSTFQVAHHALLALPLSPIDLHMQNRRWSLRTHCLQEINSQSLRIYKTQQQWIDTFTVRGLILKSVAPGHHDHLACCHGQKTGPGKPKRRSGCGQWLEPNMLWWSDEVRQSHGLHSNGMQHMCRASITQILNWIDWQKTWIYLYNITCQTDWSSS